MNISTGQLEVLHRIERDLQAKASPELAADRAMLHQVITAIDPRPHMTDADLLIAFEQGELDTEAVIDLFQRLINNGTVWHLQGSYGRYARDLINAGYCFLPPEDAPPGLNGHPAPRHCETDHARHRRI